MVPVRHIIDDFNNGQYLKYFQKLWVRLLEVYDDIKGIRRWTWQLLPDSISVKAHLGENDGS
jgi:hypothetical protein